MLQGLCYGCPKQALLTRIVALIVSAQWDFRTRRDRLLCVSHPSSLPVEVLTEVILSQFCHYMLGAGLASSWTKRSHVDLRGRWSNVIWKSWI